METLCFTLWQTYATSISLRPGGYHLKSLPQWLPSQACPTSRRMCSIVQCWRQSNVCNTAIQLQNTANQHVCWGGPLMFECTTNSLLGSLSIELSKEDSNIPLRKAHLHICIPSVSIGISGSALTQRPLICFMKILKG